MANTGLEGQFRNLFTCRGGKTSPEGTNTYRVEAVTPSARTSRPLGRRSVERGAIPAGEVCAGGVRALVELQHRIIR
jgi:hypothetical protein